MRPPDEPNVTVHPTAAPAAGVWTLAGEHPIIADAGGPATLLVPSEKVLLLAVDLPLSTRAQRLEALPFAIEDRIADPIESVHLAIGAELAPRQYLVGVVRHSVMAEWLALADVAGLEHAMLVPDALALARPAESAWTVEQANGRALVRVGDGTGFALPAALLPAAWEAAGRPPVRSQGEPLAVVIDAQSVAPMPLAEALAVPALNLRQGRYAQRARSSTFARKLAVVAAAAVAAHVVIAAADTMMLRAIADRREAETRQLLQTAAPDLANTSDIAAGIADRLPRPTGDNRFLPLLARVSAVLQPLSSSVGIRSIAWDGTAVVVDLDPGDAGVADRLRAALTEARVQGRVVADPAGGLRITAAGA